MWATATTGTSSNTMCALPPRAPSSAAVCSPVPTSLVRRTGGCCGLASTWPGSMFRATLLTAARLAAWDASLGALRRSASAVQAPVAACHCCLPVAASLMLPLVTPRRTLRATADSRRRTTRPTSSTGSASARASSRPITRHRPPRLGAALTVTETAVGTTAAEMAETAAEMA
eukprot:scaffold62552_cov69-Phaeocystis_antarctica.AAC.3